MINHFKYTYKFILKIMDDGENFLSDKKLLNYMEESDIRKIAELFSNGQFDEIINTYFKKVQINKSEKINIQTIQQFFGEENSNNFLENSPTNKNKDNNNDNFSNSNNDLYFVSKNDNSDADENTINKTRTFQGFGESLVDFDFILNTPPSTKKNNLNNLYNEDKNDKSSKSKMNNFSTGIIDNYYNSNSDEKVYDYSLLEKCEKDKLTLQILLTIVLYCLLKLKEDNEIKSLLVKYNIPNDKSIFPLILLRAKYYYKNKVVSKCLDIYTEAINNYNIFKTNINNINFNNDDIIYIETYKQEFVYFSNLFNYLFALNNIDSKIKKLYYEQKFCLYFLNFYSQGYKLLFELYNKYPDDVQIQFELAKDSIFLSKYDIFKEMFEVLKANMEKEKDENKKLIYTNYLLYIQGLSYLSLGKVDETRNSFTEILKNDSTNVVILNNNALLSIYKNKAKESLDILNLIQSPNQLNCYNDAIQENINILNQKFNANLQK